MGQPIKWFRIKRLWWAFQNMCAWMYVIVFHRLKHLAGIDSWTFEHIKATKEPTIWYLTPRLYRELDVEYAYPALYPDEGGRG